MRLLAAVVVASASLASVAPDALAQCINGWCKGACNLAGECWYTKVISSANYPYVIYLEKTPTGTQKLEANCHLYTSRYIRDNGSRSKWFQQMPGSVGQGVLDSVCN